MEAGGAETEPNFATKNQDGPLSGIRVLDVTQWYSGPFASLLLSGLGAEVIKISSPEIGDPVANAPPFVGTQGVSFEKLNEKDMGLAYLKRNRGKKSITLNLKDRRGRELFLELARTSDVIIENFRVGVTDRIGIDYETVSKANPSIVYCAITGFGSSGPDKTRKAYDTMAQAAAGLMSITGEHKGPPLKAGSALSDGIAGTFSAMSILAAVIRKLRTGKGEFVDISMVDCLFSLVFDEPLDCYEKLGVPARQGNRMTRFSPFNSYETLDRWVVIGAATAEDWDNILTVIGREDLQQHPDYSRIEWRLQHNANIDEIVGNWCAMRSSEDVVALMSEHSVPCSVVLNIHDIMRSEQIIARQMIEKVRHPVDGELSIAHAAAFPVKFRDAKTGYASAAPLIGEHTNEILTDLLHLSVEQITKMRNSGVI